jgi:competence protein ComEC
MAVLEEKNMTIFPVHEQPTRQAHALKTVLVLTLLANIWAPAFAQEASSLEVRRTTDASAQRVSGTTNILLHEAFDQSLARIPINSKLNIIGLPESGVENLPGREDNRPRILHTGPEEFRFSEKAASLVAPAVEPKLKPDWMLAHYIDVGQGNATLLEFSCGAALIDTGGQFTDNAALTSYLNEFFQRRSDLKHKLALVVLTHPHIDHTRGVTALLTAGTKPFVLGSVVVNARTNGSGWSQQNKLIQYAKAKSIPLSLITNESIKRSDGLTNGAIDPLQCGAAGPDIRALWGSDSSSHAWTGQANNHSVVIRVDFGESSFLFTGDMEEDAQPEFVASYARNPDIIDADIYQVGHHGSRNGTTAALLKVMTPEIAVMGAGNPANEEGAFSAYAYGHPNREAIELLSDATFGVTMHRPEGTFAVGIKGGRPGHATKPPRYGFQKISKAIFSTGWDGDIVIAAHQDGQKIVQTD